MFKRKLFLFTYETSRENSVHVYGSTMDDATKNFWKFANEYVKTPGVSMDIIEVKLIGDVIVQLEPAL